MVSSTSLCSNINGIRCFLNENFSSSLQSLVIPDKFQHILRIVSTNIDGKRKVMFALTAIKGIGRRFSNVVLKKADVDLDKRAGECTEEEVTDFRSLRVSLALISQISRKSIRTC